MVGVGAATSSVARACLPLAEPPTLPSSHPARIAPGSPFWYNTTVNGDAVNVLPVQNRPGGGNRSISQHLYPPPV